MLLHSPSNANQCLREASDELLEDLSCEELEDNAAKVVENQDLIHT